MAEQRMMKKYSWKSRLSIETDLYDDQMHIPYAIGIPHQLSEEGILALRKGLHKLSGLSVDLMFPVSPRP